MGVAVKAAEAAVAEAEQALTVVVAEAHAKGAMEATAVEEAMAAVPAITTAAWPCPRRWSCAGVGSWIRPSPTAE